MLGLLKKIALDERGFTTIEWIIILALSGGMATAAIAKLLPAMQSAHATTVNRISNLQESGF